MSSIQSFTDASHLLHHICRSHYCLTYEQWKEIFEDILQQVAYEEEAEREYLDALPTFWESISDN